MNLPRLIASLGVSASLLVASPMAASAIAVAPVELPEIPNASAVSDAGTALISYHDLQQLAIIDTNGKTTKVDLGCNPIAVEISPTSDFGWAICASSNPNIYIIDIAKAEVSVATLNFGTATTLQYLPRLKRLVIGEASGKLIFLSARDLNDYGLIRTVNLGSPLAAIAASNDEKFIYAVAPQGTFTRVDVAKGTRKTVNPRISKGNFQAAAVSMNNSVLYLVGNQGRTDTVDSVAIAINLTSGRVINRVALFSEKDIYTTFSADVGVNSLYVTSGMGFGLGEDRSAVARIQLASNGSLGTYSELAPDKLSGSSLALSGNGRHLLFTTMDPKAIWLGTSESINRAGLSVSGKIDNARISVAGNASGIRTGTKLTVYVRDNSLLGSPFVAQSSQATVGRTGHFSWSGTTDLTRVEVYVGTGNRESGKILLGD